MIKIAKGYPLSAVRALALHAQGLAGENSPGMAFLPEPPRYPGPDEIYQVVERLGCVQIDTLQMVRRSHYLAVWSRLGNYDAADLDRLIYEPSQRQLFEGWQHAAAIIPMGDYRYQMPHQRWLREMPAEQSARWLSEQGSQELMQSVLQRIQQEGALRAADFEYDGPKRSGWWDWKPAKNALEYLYAWGELMISKRINFQRVYDLTERVLPAWVDRSEPSMEGRDRYWIEQGVRALGICQPVQALDYSFRKRTAGKPIITELIKEGVVVEIQAELADGKMHTMVVHRDSLEWLERYLAGEFSARRTTFLSPFDNLFWGRGRDVMVWNFKQSLEAYKPAPTRQWGYFCMPILHHDRLVGRFDPKLDRQNGRLYLRALYLEPGNEPDEVLILAVAEAMRDFLAFHEVGELAIERSQPQEFGLKLGRAV